MPKPNQLRSGLTWFFLSLGTGFWLFALALAPRYSNSIPARLVAVPDCQFQNQPLEDCGWTEYSPETKHQLNLVEPNLDSLPSQEGNSDGWIPTTPDVFNTMSHADWIRRTKAPDTIQFRSKRSIGDRSEAWTVYTIDYSKTPPRVDGQTHFYYAQIDSAFP